MSQHAFLCPYCANSLNASTITVCTINPKRVTKMLSNDYGQKAKHNFVHAHKNRCTRKKSPHNYPMLLISDCLTRFQLLWKEQLRPCPSTTGDFVLLLTQPKDVTLP